MNATSRGAPGSEAGGTAAAARALLERVLHGAGASVAPGTMQREQPLVFDPRFWGELLAVEERGETRAACTLLVREFVIEDERDRVTIERGLIAAHQRAEGLDFAGKHAVDERRVGGRVRRRRPVGRRARHVTTSLATYPPMPSLRRPGVVAGRNHLPSAERKA